MKNYTAQNAFEYDSMRYNHSFNKKFEEIKNFIDNNSLVENISIGEIGHGSGRLCYNIAKHFSKNKVYGFEINNGFVQYARNNFNLNNLTFEKLNIEEQSPKEQFNILISIDVLHHLDNIDKGINNINKCISKNGYWIAIEPNIKNIYILNNDEFAGDCNTCNEDSCKGGIYFRHIVGNSWHSLDSKFYNLLLCNWYIILITIFILKD